MTIVSLFITLLIIVGVIWILLKVEDFKFKFFAIIVIAILLFGYFSFSVTLKGKDINYASPSGLFNAVKIYFSWMFGFLGNMKSVVSNAIKMDWEAKNETQVIK